MPRTKKTEEKKANAKSTQTKVAKTEKKFVVKQKKDEITVDVMDMKGKIIETIDLPKDIFGAPVNKELLTQAVRVYLANQRRGTVSTKTRGEVKGSTKKIHRQKGTGRARHGSKRAPIFVHGGLVFGPKPRDYSLKLPEKMKRKALFSALSAKARDKNFKIVAGLEKMKPKTKEFVHVLKNLSLDGKKKNILFVVPSYSNEMKSVVKAVRNVEGVSYIAAYQLSPYEVLKSRTILCMKDAISAMEETFLKTK